MNLRAFEELAEEYWAEIPDDYKHGVDGVRVLRLAKAHDELPDVWTMGECVTEAFPSDFGGPETTRSAIVLYHGSFAKLAQQDVAFDWEDELWETITHELQHHLESLAGEDALEDVDYAADENFKRQDGAPFDPTFYRAGIDAGEVAPFFRIEGDAEPVALLTWRVETDWFFELEFPESRPPSGRVVLDWLGAHHAFILPQPTADVTFVVLADGFEPAPHPEHHVDEVCLVLVRRPSLWRGALDALLGRTPSVDQIEVTVGTIRT